MAFNLTCPNCGERGVHEFRFGGEITTRPAPDAPKDRWTDYLYCHANVAGLQREWWYHRLGCRKWFEAERDTVSNRVRQTTWPEKGRR